VACSSDGGIALALPGFTLLILAILGCLGYKYINIDPDAEEEDVGTVGFMGVGLEMEMKATKQAHMEQDQHKGQDAKEIEDLIRDLGGIIRILVGHLQMLAIFHASMPHVAWPPLIRYLSQMAVVLNLNLIHLVPVGCLMDGMDSFYGTFSLTVAIPAAVWMILACKAGIEQGSLCRRHDGQKQITDRQVKTFIWIIYLMYPFICSTVLQLFNCREIEGTWFISADVSLVCYDDTYFLYAYVGLAAFAMYVVGIPFVLYLILKHNEDKLWSDSHTMERYGVLYLPYKEDRWSAELVEMVRKLMLVGPVIFFMPESGIQIGLPTLLSFAFLILHFEKQPFQSRAVNKAYTSSIMAIVLTLGCAMVLVGLGCVTSGEDGESEYTIMQWALYGGMMVFNACAVGTLIRTAYGQMVSVQSLRARAAASPL